MTAAAAWPPQQPLRLPQQHHQQPRLQHLLLQQHLLLPLQQHHPLQQHLPRQQHLPLQQLLPLLLSLLPAPTRRGAGVDAYPARSLPSPQVRR